MWSSSRRGGAPGSEPTSGDPWPRLYQVRPVAAVAGGRRPVHHVDDAGPRHPAKAGRLGAGSGLRQGRCSFLYHSRPMDFVERDAGGGGSSPLPSLRRPSLFECVRRRDAARWRTLRGGESALSPPFRGPVRDARPGAEPSARRPARAACGGRRSGRLVPGLPGEGAGAVAGADERRRFFRRGLPRPRPFRPRPARRFRRRSSGLGDGGRAIRRRCAAWRGSAAAWTSCPRAASSPSAPARRAERIRAPSAPRSGRRRRTDSASTARSAGPPWRPRRRRCWSSPPSAATATAIVCGRSACRADRRGIGIAPMDLGDRTPAHAEVRHAVRRAGRGAGRGRRGDGRRRLRRRDQALPDDRGPVHRRRYDGVQPGARAPVRMARGRRGRSAAPARRRRRAGLRPASRARRAPWSRRPGPGDGPGPRGPGGALGSRRRGRGRGLAARPPPAAGWPRAPRNSGAGGRGRGWPRRRPDACHARSHPQLLRRTDRPGVRGGSGRAPAAGGGGADGRGDARRLRRRGGGEGGGAGRRPASSRPLRGADGRAGGACRVGNRGGPSACTSSPA